MNLIISNLNTNWDFAEWISLNLTTGFETKWPYTYIWVDGSIRNADDWSHAWWAISFRLAMINFIRYANANAMIFVYFFHFYFNQILIRKHLKQ